MGQENLFGKFNLKSNLNDFQSNLIVLGLFFSRLSSSKLVFYWKRAMSVAANRLACFVLELCLLRNHGPFLTCVVSPECACADGDHQALGW